MEKGIEFGILIVDDDASSLESLYRSLKRLKYTVHSCNDPYQAEFMLKSYKIDMVLTDIMMPGINGFELSRHLLKRYPCLKIYGYTGFYREEFELEGKRSGLEGILSKPLDIRELNRIIQREKLLDSLTD